MSGVTQHDQDAEALEFIIRTYVPSLVPGGRNPSANALAALARFKERQGTLDNIALSAFVFLGEYEALHPERELNGQEALRDELAGLAASVVEGEPDAEA